MGLYTYTWSMVFFSHTYHPLEMNRTWKFSSSSFAFPLPFEWWTCSIMGWKAHLKKLEHERRWMVKMEWRDWCLNTAMEGCSTLQELSPLNALNPMRSIKPGRRDVFRVWIPERKVWKLTSMCFLFSHASIFGKNYGICLFILFIFIYVALPLPP